MPRPKTFKGDVVTGATPDWAPLLWLTNEREVVGAFMWMCAIELEDKRRLDAFKHQVTRRYLHLDRDGNTFAYTENGRYQPCATFAVLIAVLRGDRDLAFDDDLRRASDRALRHWIAREYDVGDEDDDDES